MPSKISATVAPEKGTTPGGHLVEHDAERKQIRARIQLFAPRLFRRHVRDRAHRAARAGQELVVARRASACASLTSLHDSAAGCRAVVSFARPKSRIFAWPRVDEKNIGGLDVAVNDALRVRGFESVGDLNADLEKFRSPRSASRRCDASASGPRAAPWR